MAWSRRSSKLAPLVDLQKLLHRRVVDERNERLVRARRLHLRHRRRLDLALVERVAEEDAERPELDPDAGQRAEGAADRPLFLPGGDECLDMLAPDVGDDLGHALTVEEGSKRVDGRLVAGDRSRALALGPQARPPADADRGHG